MNVRKFIAANARDALRKVKETLGNDAIILSNRGVPGGVEIMAVAARDMAMIAPTPVADSAPAPRPRPVVDTDDDYRVVLNSARARISQPLPPQAVVPPAPTMQRPPVNHAIPQRTAGPVNAGIPKNGGLRNLELTRPQQTVAPRPAVAAAPAVALAAAAPQAPAPAPRRPEAEVVPMEVMEEIRSLRKIVEQHLMRTVDALTGSGGMGEIALFDGRGQLAFEVRDEFVGELLVQDALLGVNDPIPLQADRLPVDGSPVGRHEIRRRQLKHRTAAFPRTRR